MERSDHRRDAKVVSDLQRGHQRPHWRDFQDIDAPILRGNQEELGHLPGQGGVSDPHGDARAVSIQSDPASDLCGDSASALSNPSDPASGPCDDLAESGPHDALLVSDPHGGLGVWGPNGGLGVWGLRGDLEGWDQHDDQAELDRCRWQV
jgi:hypothetical protein